MARADQSTDKRTAERQEAAAIGGKNFCGVDGTFDRQFGKERELEGVGPRRP